MTELEAARLELVFVDTGAQDYQTLVADLLVGADPQRELEVHLLEGGRDGIGQISEVLAGHDDVDAVHIVAHGTDGAVKLGDTVHIEMKVAEKKETSKTDRGVVSFDVQVANQDGQTVIEGPWTLLMRREQE